jgi:hypothetical protein
LIVRRIRPTSREGKERGNEEDLTTDKHRFSQIIRKELVHG